MCGGRLCYCKRMEKQAFLVLCSAAQGRMLYGALAEVPAEKYKRRDRLARLLARSAGSSQYRISAIAGRGGVAGQKHYWLERAASAGKRSFGWPAQGSAGLCLNKRQQPWREPGLLVCGDPVWPQLPLAANYFSCRTLAMLTRALLICSTASWLASSPSPLAIACMILRCSVSIIGMRSGLVSDLWRASLTKL